MYGESCDDGDVFTSAAFPAFDTGLTAGQVNDQYIWTKYVVINGLGKEICLGTNLQTSIDTITPNPVYYSQNLTLVISFSNPRDTPYEIEGGNVDVTTSFLINIRIYNSSDSSQVVYSSQYAISDNIGPDENINVTILWPAIAHSGTYTVRVDVDIDDDIRECDETDNYDTQNFELKPITIPVILIDGNETSVFPYPNVPYNLSFYLKNSDNNTLSNASVIITEKNGLNLMAPTQIYNKTVDASNNTERSGLVVESKVSFTTDYYGNASFTFIPTYNLLYGSEYSYLNLEDHIGNYSLYFEGTQEDNQSFVFIDGGNITYYYYFSIDNTSYVGPHGNKRLINEEMSGQILDFIYQTFTNFLETVLDEF
jgi:hypothetical protein